MKSIIDSDSNYSSNNDQMTGMNIIITIQPRTHLDSGVQYSLLPPARWEIKFKTNFVGLYIVYRDALMRLMQQ